MSKEFVISGHPNIGQSNANSAILQSLNKHINDIEVRRLDTLYFNNPVDVEAEQKALLDGEFIVLQFPFHWHSYRHYSSAGLAGYLPIILRLALRETSDSYVVSPL